MSDRENTDQMYNLGMVVFYMKNGKPHSAPILSRKVVDNLHEDWIATPEQSHTFARFGKTRIEYSTIHGEFFHHDCFPTKEELLASL